MKLAFVGTYVRYPRLMYVNSCKTLIVILNDTQIRVIEKPELITASEKEAITDVDMARLEYAKVDGPNITLAYMADDKNHVGPCISY